MKEFRQKIDGVRGKEDTKCKQSLVQARDRARLQLRGRGGWLESMSTGSNPQPCRARQVSRRWRSRGLSVKASLGKKIGTPQFNK
jgi:hypothetical protein